MILYSKSGNFLGIGKDELSFLGYEDLDEFKSLHSDIADLFINKPGYIFKFKNFSWIDYALHSGAPKKSVILKLKNGSEIEVGLKIKEVFLYTQSKDEDIYYCIEFLSNSLQSMTTISEPPIQELIAPKEIESEETSTYDDTYITEDAPIEKDFSEDFNIETQSDMPPPKLKIDNSIFEETEIEIDITHDNTPANIKIDEDYTKNDIDANLDFDLAQCVENLGLDISLVCELLSDYAQQIDSTIPLIKSSIQDDDDTALKSNIYELKGISDNLQISQLSLVLQDILEADIKDMKLQKFEKFEKLVIQFREELA